MDKTNWTPSERIRSIVLRELYVALKPVRFRDLWASCRGQLSKVSFVKALGHLCDEGKIIKEKKGRKCVEFQLNQRDPEVKKVLLTQRSLRNRMESHQRLYQDTMRMYQKVLAKTPERSRRTEIIRALVFAQASTLASMIINLTFAEVALLRNSTEVALERALTLDMIERLRRVQQREFSKTLKIDREATIGALNDWFAGLMQIQKDLPPIVV